MNPSVVTPRLSTDAALCARGVVVRGNGKVNVIEIHLAIGIPVRLTGTDGRDREWRV